MLQRHAITLSGDDGKTRGAMEAAGNAMAATLVTMDADDRVVREEGRTAAVLSFWAIRQVSTGSYLPLFQGRKTRGFTYAEPDDFLPPRLFGTPNSARVALTWWLRGPVRYVTRHFMDEPELVYDTGRTDREAADFEVVRVEVRPCG